jgi:hypothetical protein
MSGRNWRAFTHLHLGAQADDRRVALTAVLADAINLGLTRMAEACTVASYRQLAWTAAWHLREETYRQALTTLVNAQQRQPLPPLIACFQSSSMGASFDARNRVPMLTPTAPSMRAAAMPRPS